MFSVSVVPPDLQHDDAILQTALALQNLQFTIDSVFDRINQRIAKNVINLEKIDERLATAKAKVNVVLGTKKAVQINAPSTFIASHLFVGIPQTFPSHIPQNAPTDLQDYKLKSKELITSSAQDKLLFFHVRQAADKSTDKDVIGMGTLPKNLRSINSLLLHEAGCAYAFDDESNDLPSRKLRMKQINRQANLHGSPATIKQQINPAPHSLSLHLAQRQPTPSGGLRYTPKLYEAPEIDLPLDLPDLPGVAGDISFEIHNENKIIAPSFVQFVPQKNLHEAEPADFNIDEKDSTAEAILPTKPGATVENVAEPAPVLGNTSLPPPPPPPPPVTTASPLNAKKSEIVTVSKSSISANPDSRSQLMDAIRKAGGIEGGRLRAAAPITHNKVEKEKPKPSGGDLMADLHNKLLMRRKGISGNKFGHDSRTVTMPSGNPVISRLSDLIPAPQQHVSDDDDDNGNDDDADWMD